jgi:phosphatidylglycerol lysyltransferase
VAFHAIVPDLLDVYRAQGFRILKIGEEAMVDLATFTTRTALAGDFRRVRNRAARTGLTVARHDPPHPAALMHEVEDISNEWLSIPGRRERTFTLGRFERPYLASSPLVVARDTDGTALAFVNLIPCYPETDATIDLMRHRVRVPNGTMDFLFLELLIGLARTHRRFSLGLAPLSGVGDRPGASIEERAVHQIYEHVNRFFSYKGLRSYKAKFEPIWEERFLAYSGPPTTLIQVGLALSRLTEERLDA